jgi:hypothetical protein
VGDGMLLTSPDPSTRHFPYYLARWDFQDNDRNEWVRIASLYETPEGVARVTSKGVPIKFVHVSDARTSRIPIGYARTQQAHNNLQVGTTPALTGQVRCC